MKAHWKSLLIGAFLSGFVVLLGGFNANKPRIVVLQSFDQDVPWVRHVDDGLRDVLRQNRRPVAVAWHYMGLNRKLRPEQREAAAIEARRFIAQQDPDIVIAVDDESSAYVARHLAGRDRPRLVFVSISQPPEHYGYAGAHNVTGIAEKLPLVAVRDAMLTIRPGRSLRIAALAVDNQTGQAELAQVQSFDWSPHQLTSATKVSSFAQWQAFVRNASGQADVLLVLSDEGLAHSSSDARPVAGSTVTQWTEANSLLLPLGIEDSYVEEGGSLKVSPSPVDYGQQAMRLALTWVDAGAAPPPAVVTSSHFNVGMRASALAARGVRLPAIYVEAARLGNSLFP